jgi:Protein of unknown function (DUF3309)
LPLTAALAGAAASALKLTLIVAGLVRIALGPLALARTILLALAALTPLSLSALLTRVPILTIRHWKPPLKDGKKRSSAPAAFQEACPTAPSSGLWHPPCNDVVPKEVAMGLVLLIVLVLLLLGAIPTWSYSRNWGFGPSGILGVILIVVVVLLLTGRL